MIMVTVMNLNLSKIKGRLHKVGLVEDDYDHSVDSKVPASVNDFFVIRFAVCAEKANDKDIGKFGVAIVKLVI